MQLPGVTWRHLAVNVAVTNISNDNSTTEGSEVIHQDVARAGEKGKVYKLQGA